MKYLWLYIGIIFLVLLGILFLLNPKYFPISNDDVSRFWLNTDNFIQHIKYGLVPSKLYQVNIPVLYINLDKDEDRRDYMESQFKKYNIKAERVAGIYGKELKSLHHSSPGEEIEFINNYDNLVPGEVGCTLAHLKAIRTVLEKDNEYVLIVEDDCCFELIPYWPHSLEDILNMAPKDWDILQLATVNCSFRKDGPFVKQNTKYKNENRYCWSNGAYIVRKKTAQKIMDIVGKNKFILGQKQKDGSLFPENGSADSFIYDLVTSYSYTIPLLFQYNINLESTIHPSHTPTHLANALLILNSYIKTNNDWLSTLNPQQVQMAITLTDMDKELQHHNIKYFLTDGTLLGAFREGQFINNDPDIDLGVIFSERLLEFPKFMGLFTKTREFGTPTNGYECTYQHNVTKIPVDIFIFYPLENEGYWSASYNGLCNNAKNKLCRWKVRPFELKPYSFLHSFFNVPEPTDKYLEDRYGKNWNIPHSFNYSDGMNKAFYRGLILTDFSNQADVSQYHIKEEKKIFNLWPRKIRDSKKPIIWMYWQNAPGKTKPPYLNLCFQTIQKACGDKFEILMMNDESVEIISRTIHKNFRNIEPLGMRADYIRFTLVSEYGGVWLDSDTIALQSLDFISELLKTYNFVGFEHDDIGDISIGIFGGNPHNKICLFMKNLFETEFNQWVYKKHTMKWAEPTLKLSKFIKELQKIYKKEYYTVYAPKTVYPIHWKKSKDYFWKEGDVATDILQFLAICLHNETYDNSVKTMSEDKVLNSNLRISKIFNHALQN